MAAHKPIQAVVRRPRVSDESLFDSPLSVPAGTVYDEMGLDPSSTAEEVGWAAKSLNDKRLAECNRLELAQKAIFQKVSGLEQTYKKLEDLKVSSNPDQGELRRVQKRLAELEALASNLDPSFQERRSRLKELRQQIDELNLMSLKEPGKLRRYDLKHPPLALLKLFPATRDEFLAQPRTLLWLLRREMMKFIESQGESVAYISDLDREDFTGDFLPNRILDGEGD